MNNQESYSAELSRMVLYATVGCAERICGVEVMYRMVSAIQHGDATIYMSKPGYSIEELEERAEMLQNLLDKRAALIAGLPGKLDQCLAKSKTHPAGEDRYNRACRVHAYLKAIKEPERLAPLARYKDPLELILICMDEDQNAGDTPRNVDDVLQDIQQYPQFYDRFHSLEDAYQDEPWLSRGIRPTMQQ